MAGCRDVSCAKLRFVYITSVYEQWQVCTVFMCYRVYYQYTCNKALIDVCYEMFSMQNCSLCILTYFRCIFTNSKCIFINSRRIFINSRRIFTHFRCISVSTLLILDGLTSAVEYQYQTTDILVV